MYSNRNTKEDYDPSRETIQQYGIRRAEELAREKREKEEAQKASIAEATAKLTAAREAQEAETRRKQEAYLANQRALTAQRQEQEERLMKAHARQSYRGTDGSFEQDWPAIRARMAADEIARQQQADQRRLSRDF